MDKSEVDVVSIPVESERNSIGDWLPDSLRHAISPLLIGALFGVFWETIILPKLFYGFPSPVQGAFILALIFSPFMYKFLLPNKKGDWNEYAMGLGILGFVYSLIWFTQVGPLLCGGYLSIMVWAWINSTWWQYDLPSFRYGLWHAIGIEIGAMAGAILAHIYL
jgi:hypothetical protein